MVNAPSRYVAVYQLFNCQLYLTISEFFVLYLGVPQIKNAPEVVLLWFQ